MSPVFRHGSLRLYLLKLLDEAPRHGYEVIRLLQDRFLGVYAPSPGTIYPRLARLEEEGLVTHDEADGKKVYRITDKGREELHARLDDLAELEEEITASVRDIAREVSEDVRETVRSLREELASAARDMGKGRARPGGDARQDRDAGQSAQQGAGRARGGERGKGRAWDEAGDVWGQAAAEDEPEDETGRGGRGGRGWSDWPGWAGGPGWGGGSGRGGGSGWGGWPGAGGPSGRTYRDLERLARQFARELRSAAWHAQAVSEDALADLRVILDETLDRIKAEVFAATAGQPRPTDAAGGPSPGTGKKAGSGPDTGREWRGETPPDTGQGAGGPDTGQGAGGGPDTGREWRGDTPPGAGSTDTN
jgi:DNA-binding PadR family transcriptional regulator